MPQNVGDLLQTSAISYHVCRRRVAEAVRSPARAVQSDSLQECAYQRSGSGRSKRQMRWVCREENFPVD
jgi:hypothetical protein